MSAHILTSGYWPSYPVLEANLPAELTQYQVQAPAPAAWKHLSASLLTASDLAASQGIESVFSPHRDCVSLSGLS